MNKILNFTPFENNQSNKLMTRVELIYVESIKKV